MHAAAALAMQIAIDGTAVPLQHVDVCSGARRELRAGWNSERGCAACGHAASAAVVAVVAVQAAVGWGRGIDLCRAVLRRFARTRVTACSATAGAEVLVTVRATLVADHGAAVLQGGVARLH